eukprot:2576694-Prymnesium_polylepis.1
MSSVVVMKRVGCCFAAVSAVSAVVRTWPTRSASSASRWGNPPRLHTAPQFERCTPVWEAISAISPRAISPELAQSELRDSRVPPRSTHVYASLLGDLSTSQPSKKCLTHPEWVYVCEMRNLRFAQFAIRAFRYKAAPRGASVTKMNETKVV